MLQFAASVDASEVEKERANLGCLFRAKTVQTEEIAPTILQKVVRTPLSNGTGLGGRGRLVAELAFTIEPLCRKWAAVWPEVARGIHRCFNKLNLCPVD